MDNEPGEETVSSPGFVWTIKRRPHAEGAEDTEDAGRKVLPRRPWQAVHQFQEQLVILRERRAKP
jgi:hypothetical protein